MSTFSGIEMARKALNAFSLGMETVGHNISNMNTEGYSRQQVQYATVTPKDLPGVGQVGQGVQVTEIKRVRDEFLDYQYRANVADLGYWDTIYNFYEYIQNYIAEPDGEGISAAMTGFMNDMQSLQQTPEDSAIRRQVLESADTLSTLLSSTIKGIDGYADTLNQQVLNAVDDVNTMLHQISALNKQIYNAEALDQNANDLRDQRDLLLDKLCEALDVSIQEPLEYGEVNGEFFVTLNGRALVQGDHVRELVAHSFTWDGKEYYDVQVAQNEFDLVSNCSVADVLATGPDGTYVLSVDRVANGEEWTVGGGDAVCLETRSVTTATFENGTILTDDSDKTITRKLSFATLINDDEDPVSFDVDITWDDTNSVWKMTATKTKGKDSDDFASSITTEQSTSGDTLTMSDLHTFLTGLLSDTDLTNSGMTITLNSDSTAITFTSKDSDGDGTPDYPMTINDYSGLLGALSEAKYELKGDWGATMMRTRPATATEALGLSGSFRIQVGTQGTAITSDVFSASSGTVLGKGSAGDVHTFRVGAGSQQVDITASWNSSTSEWELTSDVFVSGKNTSALTGYPLSAGGTLEVSELAKFMNDAFTAGSLSLRASANSSGTAFSLTSTDNHLLAVSDVTGSLAGKLGIAGENPVITIDVAETDSLTIIRNKINEKYQEEYGLTEPEQWVHSSLVQDSDGSWYLTIAADVAGEAQRITLMGSEDGNMQVLRRLGLTANEAISDGSGGVAGYREVAAVAAEAQDASFTLNGVRYLSSDNRFNKARRVPALGDSSDYSASELVQVEEGMWFNLKETGAGMTTTITVNHHVKGGTIKALEEARDGLIPDLEGMLNEMTLGLVKNVNAYHYSGYGMGKDITVTGTAFFEPLSTQARAAQKLSVNDALIADNSLIAAAMGKLDGEGKAASGVSGGSGNGANAGRMALLSSAKAMGDMSFGSFYNSFLSRIGSEGGSAKIMYNMKNTLVEQIDAQRQAVSGVSLDEELLNIVSLTKAYGAMSRYVNAIDEMLDKIINGFGLVGR